MRVVALKGGLGNQLFQYAYGRYLKKQGYSVCYNTSWFDTFKQRRFMLPEILSISLTDDPVTDDGYWQKLKFTDPVRDEMMQEIKTQAPIDAIAIHVRRTDYLGHRKMINLGEEYYDRAYASMPKGLPVYLFSDDNDYNVSYPKTTHVRLNDVDSFKLMRRCTHKIIANSTYSWWAAYLSESTVIAPSKWWKNSTKYEQGLLPENWKTI